MSQNKIKRALAGVAPLLGRGPINQKVTGSVLHQSTCLGCRFSLGRGVYAGHPINDSLSHRRFSPSLSPSTPPSLKSMSMSLGRGAKNFFNNKKEKEKH